LAADIQRIFGFASSHLKDYHSVGITRICRSSHDNVSFHWLSVTLYWKVYRMADHPIDPTVVGHESQESSGFEPPERERRSLIDRLSGGSPGLRTPSPHESIPGLRVPKEKLRLAAVSRELPEALSVLADQIHKAEQFLRKHPGSDRARVALDHVYLPELHVGSEAFLETRRDERGNCKIVVRYYAIESESCFAMTDLDEFPITTRIELCKSIPELIEAAVAAQSLVAGDVLTTAEAIEDALKRYRDNTI
jgi:hypothetical protein